MKSIKKITNKVTDNFSTLAGSALLVGATLTGGAAFAAAQSGSSGNSMDLGDYPMPFVDEEGQVDASIVVGEDAKTADVVSAVDIAGSLGNAAFEETETSVNVEGSATGGSFSATGGVTLDTVNDPLFFGDSLNEVRDTLTDDQLRQLETTTFTEGDADAEIENFLRISPDRQIQFGQPEDRDDEDPVLFVDNPEDVDESEYLFNLQADFDEDIDFTDEDVQSEDIELMGQTFTVGTDSEAGDSLVLLGSQDIISLDNTNDADTATQTTTIDGEEVTMELVSVTGDGNQASIRVNGELETENVDDEFTVNGVDVRIDEIVPTNTDNSEGIVDVAIGDQEIEIPESPGDVEDGDEDDVDGLFGEVVGTVDQAQGINLYVGAQDDDREYVLADEAYEHENLPGFVFRFGGLSPDVAPEDGESTVEPVSVEGSDSETLQVSMGIGGGETTSIDFLHADEDDVETDSLDADAVDLADTDDEQIVVNEGGLVAKDEYVVTDAGDFAHVFEVTNINRDATGDDIESDDEATIDLRDAIDDQNVEVDLDATGADGYYAGTEVIDGQTYSFALEGQDATGGPAEAFDAGEGDAEFHLAYGDGSSVDDTETDIDSAVSVGSTLGLYPAVDSGQRASVAFTEPVDLTTLPGGAPSLGSTGDSLDLEFPSTESTDARTVTVSHNDPGTGDDTVTVDGEVVATADGSTSGDPETTVTVGEVDYQVEVNVDDGGTSGSFDTVEILNVAATNVDTGEAGDATGALVIEPEDDADDENAYFVTTGIDTDDDELTVNEPDYVRDGTGFGDLTTQLESDDDVNAGYDVYGSYIQYDDDDGQQSFELFIPAGQAVAGAAFTGEDGSLSASGGGSGSAPTMSPTYQMADGLLDSDSSVSSAKTNENLVLVGGPAVNSLTSELVTDNQTMPASNYTEGQGMIQMVDGFEGGDAVIVAGHSAADTRAAGEFLANYRNNEGALEGKSEVTIDTETNSVVN